MKSMKLGGGGRFAALKKHLSSKPGISDPGALASAIGRRKLGKQKFQNLATAGRKRASSEY